MDDFELVGIETIARGVCIMDAHILLCAPKVGGDPRGAPSRTYLPGGHIEFKETGRQALIREVKEELGLDATTGKFLGVIENQFVQKGKDHAEISLVYELNLVGGDPRGAPQAQEDWIQFIWWPVDKIKEANLLPKEMENYVNGCCYSNV